MIRPDDKVLRAFINLEGDYNFEVIKEWFVESLTVMKDDSMNIAQDVHMRWAQGNMQNLTEILDVAKQSRVMVEKLKR